MCRNKTLRFSEIESRVLNEAQFAYKGEINDGHFCINNNEPLRETSNSPCTKDDQTFSAPCTSDHQGMKIVPLLFNIIFLQGNALTFVAHLCLSFLIPSK